jgi:hypothetical protein
MRRFALLLLLAMPAMAEQFSISLTGQAQPNCWNIQDIVSAVTKDAASDPEKALALHRFGMAHFIHFDGPIEERGEYMTDPLKLIGVYGFALCGNNTAAMNALYNAAGLKARRISIPGHSIPEVWFEGRWNYIDTDMFGYVILPDGKTMASVDDLTKDADLFVRQKNPPDPFFPFDRKEDMADVFRNAIPRRDYHPYASAHMMNLAVRTGESVTMFYRPKDRYLLTQLREDIGTVYKDYWVAGPVRQGSLAWCDKPPAAYGNGLLEYKPDLRSQAFRLENPEMEGVAVLKERQKPPLAAAAPNRPASLVVEVNSPFVIVGLQNDLTDFEDDSDAAVVTGLFWRADGSDENRILVSTDSGRTWKEVWKNRWLGAVPFQIDLSRHVVGKYSYQVKFEWIDQKGSGQVGLEGLQFKTWVELSPMALPRLVAGRNTFRISTKPRRTFYNESCWQKGEQLPGQRLENLDSFDQFPYLRPRDPQRPGVLTFDLGPKGSVDEARISVRARAVGGKPSGTFVTLELSEDDGRTWRQLDRFSGHPEHDMNHMWFNHVIKETTIEGEHCRLRLSISGGGFEKVIANSAVRTEPRAPTALRVTHVWREGDAQRTSEHMVRPGSGSEAYEVEAAKGLVNEALKIEGVAQ